MSIKNKPISGIGELLRYSGNVVHLDICVNQEDASFASQNIPVDARPIRPK